MASVKIRTNGNTTLDGVELENFSTEETLAALLEQFKIFSAGFTTDRSDTKTKTEKNQTKIEKLLAGIAGGTIGAGVAGGGERKVSDLVTKVMGPALTMFNPLADLLAEIGELTPEVLLAVVAFKLISVTLQAFQFGLNIVSRSITSLFSVTGNLISTFASGKLAMSDYISAVQRGTASIPIIGMFTSLLAEGAVSLENWNQSLLELTKMGANFGGNITQMIVGAADAGLSVEQFARVVKDNAESLATFGTVMDGVNTYTKVSRITMQEYSSQLASLGISFSQYSEELPRLLGVFGASMKAHGASDKELAQSALDLTQQFDAMSQLTGKTRDQQAADLQKLTTDAAWQQKLTSLTRNQQEGYLSALNEIQSTMGEGYAELYKFSVLGMPPLNKELQTLLATTPGLSQQFSRITAAVNSGVKGMQLTSQLNNVVADMVASGIRSGQSMQTLIAAAAAGLGGTAADVAKAQQQLLANKQEFFRNGVFDETIFRQYLDRITKSRQAQDQVSKNLTQFSNLMATLRDRFYIDIIGPLVNKLAPAVAAITKAFDEKQGPFQAIIDKVVTMVSNFGDWVVTHSAEIQEDISDFMSIVAGVMKFIVGTVQFIADHWELVKVGVAGLAVLVVGAGVGLTWIIYSAVQALIGFVSAVRAASIGIGGSGVVGGAAGAAETAAGGGILGLGEEGAAAGLGALALGESSTGVLLPLGIATGLVAGGLGLWQYLSKKKDSTSEPNVEKQSYAPDSPADNIEGHLSNLNDTMAMHTRILHSIAENTSSSAKYNKAAANALA